MKGKIMQLMRIFWLFLAVTVLAALNLSAAELTADEVIAKANQAAYYAGKDGRSDVQMTISDARGGTRQRAFTILRMNSDDDTWSGRMLGAKMTAGSGCRR
jgi:hypothetical protein